MSKEALVKGTTDAWESGALGNSLAHAKRAPAELENAVEEAMGMQAISLRLPRSTIKAYKDIAAMNGVGYQPLMRDAICRWVEGEMKRMLAGAAEVRRRKLVETEATAVVVEPPPAPKKRRRAA